MIRTLLILWLVFFTVFLCSGWPQATAFWAGLAVSCIGVLAIIRSNKHY